ncbi:MAG TPA: ATP-binding protein, partial [Spirochaetales bacterium]|nr:ATP-binding protein [Spirochaetales bacterium]
FMSIVEEGSLLIKDFIRKLVSLTGSRSSIPVSVEVMRLVKNSELEIRKRYPQMILELQINSSVKIKCYPAELIQAIEYVLENAVEANQGYEQAISVRLIEEDGAVGIIIEDQGIGIDDLNIKRVFDPFFTTKVDHEGLGLYFAKTIVERNSGQIKISSKSDGGTIVQFLFASERN